VVNNAQLFNEKMYWLGKAFRPINDHEGEGYNRTRYPGGKIVREARMATRIDKSFVDGKPSYILDYSAFNNGNGIDELRKLDDGIYFGIFTMSTGNGTRTPPDFFILIGPTDVWVGPDKN
jgi:hypothetical protein